MKSENLFTFLGGALVGAALAILFAPDSGDETRKKIRDTFDKEYQGLKNKLNNLETKAKAAANAYSAAGNDAGIPSETDDL